MTVVNELNEVRIPANGMSNGELIPGYAVS